MILDETVAQTIAEHLLQIKAIKLNNRERFTWSSGIKSPIYCDNRVLLSYPPIRTYVRQSFVKAIEELGSLDAIAGVATGGIPMGVLIAQELNLPFIYVRPKPKAHGLTNQIEGHYSKGQRVLVIEDLISTGSSSIKAIEALRNDGLEVKAVFSIFDYGFEIAQSNFKAIKLKAYSLSNFEHLCEVAKAKKFITTEDFKGIQEWRKSAFVS